MDIADHVRLGRRRGQSRLPKKGLVLTTQDVYEGSQDLRDCGVLESHVFACHCVTEFLNYGVA